MTTGIIDALVVTFALDATGFAKGEHEVDQANKRLRESNKKAFSEMEERGKSAAVAFKSVRNEVIGLGLAFMGATSILGLIGNMMTGAASAERLGETMGMATGRVWAWRKAMAGVGGQAGDADAALSTIQKAKMGWQLHGDTGNNVEYSRLGISGFDLQKKDPGAILQKIAAMQGKMDPQTYSSLLQQIGLPQSMVYFLNQGKVQVDQQIAAFEKNSTNQEALAKKTEELQKSTALLEATISKKLVPPVLEIVNLLNKLVGGNWKDDKTGITVNGKNGYDYIGDAVGGKTGDWIKSTFGDQGSWTKYVRGDRPAAGHPSAPPAGHPASGDDGQRAAAYGNAFLKAGFSATLTAAILGNMKLESHFDPNQVGDHGAARGVLQWHADRQANFRRLFGKDVSQATPAEVAEFVKWELAHLKTRDRAAIMGAAATGDAGLTARRFDEFYERSRGLTTNLRATAAQNYARRITVHQTNNFHIKSTDPKGAGHEVAKIQRRHAVAHADRGVAP